MRVSFGMIFTRLVLLSIVGLSVWGATAVFGANIELGDKIMLWLVLDAPFATALALFLATFTALDRKGRLLEGSWLYKLTDGAGWIRGGKVKFCPTFWKLGVISIVIHGVVFVAGEILFWYGYTFINHTAVTFMWTGFAVALILVAIAVAKVTIKINDRRQEVSGKISGGFSSTFAGKAIKAASDKACLTIEVAPSDKDK